MQKIPRNRVQSHSSFDLTPLGQYAVSRDAAILTPGGRYVQRRFGLPASLANLYAAINGLGEVQ
jgi:hypothetical protein